MQELERMMPVCQPKPNEREVTTLLKKRHPLRKIKGLGQLTFVTPIRERVKFKINKNKRTPSKEVLISHKGIRRVLIQETGVRHSDEQETDIMSSLVEEKSLKRKHIQEKGIIRSPVPEKGIIRNRAPEKGILRMDSTRVQSRKREAANISSFGNTKNKSDVIDLGNNRSIGCSSPKINCAPSPLQMNSIITPTENEAEIEANYKFYINDNITNKGKYEKIQVKKKSNNAKQHSENPLNQKIAPRPPFELIAKKSSSLQKLYQKMRTKRIQTELTPIRMLTRFPEVKPQNKSQRMIGQNYRLQY